MFETAAYHSIYEFIGGFLLKIASFTLKTNKPVSFYL